MPQETSSSSERLLLALVLLSGVLWRRCGSQENRGDGSKPPDGPAGDDGPFFALRSCHQLLGGDAGEFFSPDYLCSNPPLWCNWTVRVDPGNRIHLQLEDLTPDDACQLKQDQVHVDEPGGAFRAHKVLQKCWREAKFTSASDTLHVVLLIGGRPRAPYRGFHGRYQAFGPPLVYNPQEAGPPQSGGGAEEPAGPDGGEEAEEDLQQPPGRPDQPEELTAEPASTQESSRSGRGAAPTPAENQELQQDSSTQRSEVSEASDPHPPPTEGAEQTHPHPHPSEMEQTHPHPPPTEGVEQTHPHPHPSEMEQTHPHPHPNKVEPLSGRRGKLNFRNHSEAPHLPGDHLFEVAVEVTFQQDVEASWDSAATSLLLSVKALIGEQLEALHTPLALSPKRIKRLSAGVLYILWLQGPGGPQVHRAVHSGMQDLIATSVGGTHGKGVILSVSTADVNECETQMVLCDANADCVNRMGSYSCRCRPGFLDKSRLGSGGTACVDVKAAGCSPGLSAETRGVYVLFFLLSSLVLLLLAAAALLYRRHRRGAFMVRCRSDCSVSTPDSACKSDRRDEGKYGSPAGSDLPPPPPVRGVREAWPKEHRPAVDLPLLRFSPLLPPQDGRKM